MWGLSALAHSTEAFPGTVQAALNLVNVVVIVRILMRVWPHFSLSGRKCGKLDQGGFMLSLWMVKKYDFSHVAIGVFLRKGKRAKTQTCK